MYDEELPDKTILKMVTSNPAKAFRLKKNGHVKKGYIADLVIFNDKEKKPESSVVHADLQFPRAGTPNAGGQQNGEDHR